MFRIEFLFIFSLITCHSRILRCVEFKNFYSFAVCCVLLFFHNLCPEYSWIPFQWSLLRLFSAVCLSLRLYILTEKWASLKYLRVLYSKRDSLIGFSSPSLLFFFFFNKKVISCCINVYICSERSSYSY